MPRRGLPTKDHKSIYATTQLPEPPKTPVLMGIEGPGTKTDPESLESEIMEACEKKKSMDPGRFCGWMDLLAEVLTPDSG